MVFTIAPGRIVYIWTVFAIAAIYVSYRSTLASQHHIFYSLLSGGLIYLGFLAKGPVACFTFAVPVAAWLTLKAKLSKAISGTLLALATFAFLFLATSFLFEDSVKFYFS